MTIPSSSLPHVDEIDPTQGEATRRILKLISKYPFLIENRVGTPALPSATESNEEALGSESWLISYADMMTLLFGFFVMLYTVTGHFNDVQKSMRKTFGDTEKKAAQLNLEPEVFQNVIQEKETLKAQLALALENQDQLLRQIKNFKPVPTEKSTPLFSYMAITINWPTANHDIDLVVEDPSGHVFDFKHRRYASHPGVLALDTRRGPGTEVWQSERIIPGRYRITYIFYNEYGNAMPAPVSGTIFSTAGSFHLPTVMLNFHGSPKKTFNVSVGTRGEVRLLTP